MRFYLDENLPQQIAQIGRSMNVDIVSSHELGQSGKRDDEQLLFAAREQRCLVTRDLRDFILLTVRFFEQALPHGGVLVLSRDLRQRAFSAIASAIVAYEADHPEGMNPYAVHFLGPARR